MPKPTVRLIGENGNIYNLMAVASKALNSETADEMVKKITTQAKSYSEAIAILNEYVEVI